MDYEKKNSLNSKNIKKLNKKGVDIYSSIRDNAKSLMIAILIAIAIRSFIIEPYKIPSSSMKPTLLVGDFIFINKFKYGYSKFSLPFSPALWKGRILKFQEPERGDVIVFKYPKNTDIFFIKRLIGLPGDKIYLREGILYVNDNPIDKEFIGYFEDEEYVSVKMFKEKIGDTEFKVLDITDDGPMNNTAEYIVPEGHYFFMGDNRDASNDSRLEVGFVPEENLVGKAIVVFFSISDSFWKIWEWPNNIRFSRILSAID